MDDLVLQLQTPEPTKEAIMNLRLVQKARMRKVLLKPGDERTFAYERVF